LNVYFDTGLLVKLYYDEPNSAKAVALIQSYDKPIVFCGLQQTELRNALYRKCARKEMTPLQLAETLKAIQSDLDSGVLEIPDVDWPEVWREADRLTAKYALTTQCRTLDVLHVAAAKQLEIKIFGTADLRQMVVARKAGLKVISLNR